MDRDEARARMQEIQRIMERATLWTHLPGPAAVVGGLLVLVGCAVSYGMIRSLDFAAMLDLSIGGQVAFCVMWFAIGVAGVIVEVVFTARAAQKNGLVDRIGFIEEAIDRAIDLAGLKKSKTRVVHYPRPVSLFDLGLIQTRPPGSPLSQLLDLGTPRTYYLWSSLPPMVTSEARPWQDE